MSNVGNVTGAMPIYENLGYKTGIKAKQEADGTREKLEEWSRHNEELRSGSRSEVAATYEKSDDARRLQLSEMARKAVSSQVGFAVTGGVGKDDFWGAEQTSQRLFDFAAAYAGDDVEKMKTMQKAMEKGFKLAGGQWGNRLPSVCYETMDLARSKFDDWFKSHESKSDAQDIDTQETDTK